MQSFVGFFSDIALRFVRLGAAMFCAVLLAAPLSGCAQSKPPAAVSATAAVVTPATENAAPAVTQSSAFGALGSFVEKRSELVLHALSLLGVNYKFGGNSPETGLDCSGLVRLVFNKTLGLVLPRRSEEMSKVAQTVASQELQPGDLVFFNTLKKAFSHVGIYIGNGQFVHAPSTGGAVRVESMSSRYWQARFDGARRVDPDDRAAGAAAAPTLSEQFIRSLVEKSENSERQER